MPGTTELNTSMQTELFFQEKPRMYKFKRYEDASLEYMGFNKHEGEEIGLYVI